MTVSFKPITFFVLWVMVLATNSAWACPNCKLALEETPNDPAAYYYSILFMLGMIGTAFGAMTVLLWWVNRIERQSLEDAGYHHLFENGVTQGQHSR